MPTTAISTNINTDLSDLMSFDKVYEELMERVYGIDFIEGLVEELKKAHEREVNALKNELNHIETSVMSLTKPKDYALAV